MKKQINDLLLKMQSGETCIGETANKLFDLKEGPKQKKILSDEYIKKSAPAFFVSEPEASTMTNKWIEGAMWYRGKVATAMLREVELVEEPIKDSPYYFKDPIQCKHTAFANKDMAGFDRYFIDGNNGDGDEIKLEDLLKKLS